MKLLLVNDSFCIPYKIVRNKTNIQGNSFKDLNKNTIVCEGGTVPRPTVLMFYPHAQNIKNRCSNQEIS